MMRLEYKVAVYKPMDIKFDNEKEYKEFIKWADDKVTKNEAGMDKLRKDKSP
ncbi:hypothetical protein P5G51_012630 [Virgibacillus sp. 179-BFC.A HS]|uniref:Uncharacterized protein n=1 Tax=Tigheibacillus jepli TaxID=3035914 RepID=A0ABU5CIE3_9BACI|nr:hypothetical protein [Virgibacillus sp. 179-BFC.A HS]MDY0406123.1 hypothetical protein [Virgibacillus sp. 179-BFC.A HS]